MAAPQIVSHDTYTYYKDSRLTCPREGVVYRFQPRSQDIILQNVTLYAQDESHTFYAKRFCERFETQTKKDFFVVPDDWRTSPFSFSIRATAWVEPVTRSRKRKRSQHSIVRRVLKKKFDGTFTTGRHQPWGTLQGHLNLERIPTSCRTLLRESLFQWDGTTMTFSTRHNGGSVQKATFQEEGVTWTTDTSDMLDQAMTTHTAYMTAHPTCNIDV